MLIYHLTTRAEWDGARAAGFYSTASIEADGFIHCSTAEQLLPVANAFYLDLDEPIVLRIETDLLAAPLRWEAPEPDAHFEGGSFPHVYGSINLDAVIGVTGLERGPDGRFTGF
jgi:uncharacterized protein (DUF952 family)